jgi:hypothetical protein
MAEFKCYIDIDKNDFFEAKVPLLNLAAETKDFAEAINMLDENISIYLKNKYEKAYDGEHKILMQAYIKETISEK